jgi:hypothetical protein
MLWRAKVEVSFVAVDDPQTVADAIGSCFNVLLVNHRRRTLSPHTWDEWANWYADLDPRVQVNSPWPIIDDSAVPVSMFGA